MKNVILLLILLGVTTSAFSDHRNKKSKQHTYDRDQHHEQSKRKRGNHRDRHEPRHYWQQRYRRNRSFYSTPQFGIYLDYSRQFDKREHYPSTRDSQQVIRINKKVTSIFVHNNEQSTTINRAYATLGNGQTVRLSALEGKIRHGRERVLDFRSTSYVKTLTLHVARHGHINVGYESIPRW
jgi:hypothetical protein